jgi:hypothetical protein
MEEMKLNGLHSKLAYFEVLAGPLLELRHGFVVSGENAQPQAQLKNPGRYRMG